jgi:hypothetical protein
MTKLDRLARSPPDARNEPGRLLSLTRYLEPALTG